MILYLTVKWLSLCRVLCFMTNGERALEFKALKKKINAEERDFRLVAAVILDIGLSALLLLCAGSVTWTKANEAIEKQIPLSAKALAVPIALISLSVLILLSVIVEYIIQRMRLSYFRWPRILCFSCCLKYSRLDDEMSSNPTSAQELFVNPYMPATKSVNPQMVDIMDDAAMSTFTEHKTHRGKPNHARADREMQPIGESPV